VVVHTGRWPCTQEKVVVHTRGAGRAACAPFSRIIKQHSMQCSMHPYILRQKNRTTTPVTVNTTNSRTHRCPIVQRKRQERDTGSLRYHYELIRRVSHTCTAAARIQLRTRRESTLSTQRRWQSQTLQTGATAHHTIGTRSIKTSHTLTSHCTLKIHHNQVEGVAHTGGGGRASRRR